MTRASTKTYGQSSGIETYNPLTGGYMSGYIRSCIIQSGHPLGELVIGLGVNIMAVASGNAKVAIYNSGRALQAESATQTVHSGWNYFAVNPSFITVSGSRYEFAIKGDAANVSGWVMRQQTLSTNSGQSSVMSGEPYADAFPSTLAPGTLSRVSGLVYDLVMVAM